MVEIMSLLVVSARLDNLIRYIYLYLPPLVKSRGNQCVLAFFISLRILSTDEAKDLEPIFFATTQGTDWKKADDYGL